MEVVIFMKILAVDTSSKVCSVAILENRSVLDEINLNDGRTHSENLMPTIEKILDRNGMTLDDIDLIGVTVGPGSFTGIRIGIASVKAIAEVKNIPVASISSLQSLAKNISKEKGTIVSMIDARNNNVYGGIYDTDGKSIAEECADNIDTLVDKIKPFQNITFVGDGAVINKGKIQRAFYGQKVEFADNNEQSAANTGILAYEKYLSDSLESADTVSPLYLRKSQAERLNDENSNNELA